MTVDDILASLAKRGFYYGAFTNAAAVQVYAVAEELGEVARKLRRNEQGVELLSLDELAVEAADVVIAAVCLLGCCAGDKASDVIALKMRADEMRGWRHNGGAR